MVNNITTATVRGDLLDFCTFTLGILDFHTIKELKGEWLLNCLRYSSLLFQEKMEKHLHLRRCCDYNGCTFRPFQSN